MVGSCVLSASVWFSLVWFGLAWAAGLVWLVWVVLCTFFFVSVVCVSFDSVVGCWLLHGVLLRSLMHITPWLLVVPLLVVGVGMVGSKGEWQFDRRQTESRTERMNSRTTTTTTQCRSRLFTSNKRRVPTSKHQRASTNKQEDNDHARPGKSCLHLTNIRCRKRTLVVGHPQILVQQTKERVFAARQALAFCHAQ